MSLYCCQSSQSAHFFQRVFTERWSNSTVSPQKWKSLWWKLDRGCQEGLWAELMRTSAMIVLWVLQRKHSQNTSNTEAVSLSMFLSEEEWNLQSDLATSLFCYNFIISSLFIWSYCLVCDHKYSFKKSNICWLHFISISFQRRFYLWALLQTEYDSPALVLCLGFWIFHLFA